MAFAEFGEVAGPAAGYFFFLEEDVRVGAGFLDVIRTGRNVGHFQQFLEGQTLHARVLGFVHPSTGKYMEFEAPLPDYFKEIIVDLDNKCK